MKIRFTSEAHHQGERGAPRRFHAGKVYDLPETEAKRWIKRKAAEKAPDEVPEHREHEGEEG